MRIVEDAEAIALRMRDRSRGKNGGLTIGIHASLSAGNLRATLIEYRHRFPDVETHLVDGSSDHLISDLMNSAIDVAFVAEGNRRWDERALSVWSERVVVALPESHPLSNNHTILWSDLKQEPILLPQRGPGPEFQRLVIRKLGNLISDQLVHHDVALDRMLTLVGAGWGFLLALEGGTGATYPGVTFRGVHDNDGPTRLDFRAYWRESNHNPCLCPFLEMLQERYPDLSAHPATG